MSRFLLKFQTRDHNFAIYVNPVGVDATVKIQNTRCVAGGYVWNPYYTQLADPLNVRKQINVNSKTQVLNLK